MNKIDQETFPISRSAQPFAGEHIDDCDMVAARTVANAEALLAERVTPERAAHDANECSLAFAALPSEQLGQLYLVGQMLAIATVNWVRHRDTPQGDGWRKITKELSAFARETSQRAHGRG